MIGQICKNLEEQAKADRHDIGKGFQEAFLLKVPMLRMDCHHCDFFVVLDPQTGKHLKSASGLCPKSREE